ncbi:MAG: ribonuclease R [Alphaproteobacteria bacterium]
MNKSDIVNYIQTSPKPVTKREISDAFRIKGTEGRIELKKILKELENEGIITKQPGGAYGQPEALEDIALIEITDIDIDGDTFATPVKWEREGKPPRIEVMPDKKGHPPLKPGDRVLARLIQVSKNLYEARIIKKLDSEYGRVMGMVKLTKGGGLLIPASKKARHDFEISHTDLNGGKEGDIAIGEIMPGRGMRKKVRIVEILGRRDDPKAISLISLSEAGLREKFPDKVIDETKNMTVPDLKNREDLRSIPLVTIDGIDARDFDDAVFAEKTDEGFHLIVAIADVAHYVRPYSALDKEAVRRGNSTYFPDRVIPMLPEALSNELCSLKPKENRACLAAHMWIDENGNLLRYKFVRGLMRSAARLVYEQVQAAHDGLADDTTGSLLDPVIKPLYEAFYILDKARRERGALELDLPERQVIIDAKGNMTGIRLRTRVDAHKLIEEFMILANVAAAKALEAKKAPCVYRIHDRPSAEKLDSAREFVESFGLSLPKGQVTKSSQINHLLLKAAELPYSHLISTVILRTQAQAVYSPENIGHFGLSLSKYAHFTSPIRRYADLLVHRSLISAYGLGDGGMDEGEVARLEEICENISACERTSMEAERNSIDRFTAAYLSDRIGAEFQGRISGVTRFGLFVDLNESGASGIVPIRTLPQDFYVHDEKLHALVGRKSGRVFRLGAPVTVMLMEADGLSGSTVLQLIGHERGADIPGVKFKKPHFSPNDDEKRKKYGKKGFKKGPKHRR